MTGSAMEKGYRSAIIRMLIAVVLVSAPVLAGETTPIEDAGFIRSAPSPDDIYWGKGPHVQGIAGRIFALTVYDGRLIAAGAFLAAGDTVAGYIAAWDGASWTPLGDGFNDEVYALAVYKGCLVAGGIFTASGPVAVNHIAVWDGTSWSPLGSGNNGSVQSVAVYEKLWFEARHLI